jgi:hypothetical protein
MNLKITSIERGNCRPGYQEERFHISVCVNDMFTIVEVGVLVKAGVVKGFSIPTVFSEHQNVPVVQFERAYDREFLDRLERLFVDALLELMIEEG